MSRNFFLLAFLIVGITFSTESSKGQKNPPQVPPIEKRPPQRWELIFPPNLKPFKADPKDDELQKLLKARFNEVLEELLELVRLYKGSATTDDALLQSSKRTLVASLDVSERAEDRIALLTPLALFANQVQVIMELLEKERGYRISVAQRARVFRLEVEIELLRAKGKKSVSPKK